jgi:hypothetical protein
MRCSNRSLLAVTFCVAALGLVGVSSAQAARPVWDVNGAELTAGLSPEGSLILPTPKPYLLSVIVAIHFEIECSAAELIGSLKAPNLIEGKIKFTGCVSYTNKLDHATASANCKPENGEVVTTEGKGELKAGENNTVFTPKVGTEFATVKTTAKCAVGEKIPIEGVFAVKDSDGLAAGLEVNKTEHKIEENAAKTSLTALGEPAAIVGTAKVALKGTHAGQSWRGLP